MYLCTYISKYVRICVYMHVCTYVRMDGCMDVSIYVRGGINMFPD